MHIGYKNQKAEAKPFDGKITVGENEKDRGICATNDLKFTQQCIEIEKKVRKILGYIT